MITLTDEVKHWPTPRGNKIGGSTSEGYGLSLNEAVKGGRKKNWPTPRAGDALKRGNISNDQRNGLPAAVLWHTPDCSDRRSAKSKQQGLSNQVKNWPTPRAREGNSGTLANGNIDKWAAKCKLDAVVIQKEQSEGQLNADWVELLMGLPIGWTDIDKDTLDEWPGWPAPLGHQRNWATPNCMDMLPSRSPEAMKKQATNGGRKNRSLPGNLREQIDPTMRNAYVEASQENGGTLKSDIKILDQYDYEPPRTIKGQKNRAKRLKSLGNGCVTRQIYPIFATIMEIERGEKYA